MKNALLSAFILLAPAFASAGEKYVVRNGRAVTGGGGGRASGGGATVVAQGGARAAGGGVGGAPVYGQAFSGGAARRGSGGHRSFFGQRLGSGVYRVPQRAMGDSVPSDGSGSGGSGGGSGTTEEPAETPGYFKYGALIRTEGQQPQFAQASSPERDHTIAAGDIRLDTSRAYDVGRGPGVRQGRRDTPPSCSPGSSGCSSSGGSSITPNTFDPSF